MLNLFRSRRHELQKRFEALWDDDKTLCYVQEHHEGDGKKPEPNERQR